MTSSLSFSSSSSSGSTPRGFLLRGRAAGGATAGASTTSGSTMPHWRLTARKLRWEARMDIWRKSGGVERQAGDTEGGKGPVMKKSWRRMSERVGRWSVE